MNKFVRLSVIAGLLLSGASLVNTSYANDSAPVTIDQLKQLTQEPQDATVSERVTARFTRSHYRQFDLNADFSGKIFDRYLNMLDYGHNVLMASDVAQFASKRNTLGEELKSGQLTTPYALFNLAQQRRFERYNYALQVLARPMNFTGTDTINLDRAKSPWPKDRAELDSLWDAKVKYDELNLKLTGKNDQEIRDVLTKRYRFAMKRLTQSNSEDVFQLVMNAFAHEIDPHTNYLSPRSTEQFNTEMSLSLEGIGAVLQGDDDYTVINSMVAGGPAAKSKAIAVGDRIVGVGQVQAGKPSPMVDVIGWRLDDVVALIKGPKGSKVRLQILPAGKNAKNHVITLTREKIRLEDRAVKMTIKNVGSEKVAVMDIPGFYVGLTDDVKVQLQKMAKQNVNSLLVDRFSASASEIFAAAMQDYGRALIVGEPTFGKGTVQQYRSLNRIYDQMLRPEWPALGSVQYTIQKFYRINGGSTQRKGVTPEILMPTGIEAIETGEKFEDNALPWDSINAATYTKTGDLQPFIPELLKAHQARIAQDPEFQYIQQDIARYKALKDKRDIVSLNYAQRDKEDKEDDATRLTRLNERFKREGKKPLKSLDDLPKDYVAPDPYLDEADNIALDLARLQKAQSAQAPAASK